MRLSPASGNSQRIFDNRHFHGVITKLLISRELGRPAGKSASTQTIINSRQNRREHVATPGADSSSRGARDVFRSR